MDCGGGRAEHGRQRGEVVWVAGEDVVAQPQCNDHQVGIDDVCGLGLGEKAANGTAVFEGVDSDGLEECREACLAGSISPNLSNDRVRGVESGF